MNKQEVLRNLSGDALDARFFLQHPERHVHIRLAALNECAEQFASLGDHQRDRRRIILWRVPPGNPYYNRDRPQILKIPFLAFFDEEIADTDAVLMPILHDIMSGAAAP